MTRRRAPPGVQVSAGRIRVDAAKALAKLRAYRLTDPTAWILEAIRAAVASGATAIELDGDANDVWLRWAGPAWPAGELPHLFDELVSPEQGRDAYHRRLLATAINSALGLEPAWIDVVAIEAGAAMRVRFTPAIATPDDDELAPRRTPAVEAVRRPDGPAGDGMRIHLRRPAGLGVLARFLWAVDPPELVLARAACADLAVPMTIAGAPIGRDHGGGDLLRAPLGESLDGFVALLDPRAPRAAQVGATLDVAELGVHVTSEPWLPRDLEAHGLADRRPLRLFIDGPRMPTNASRSQVRRDTHPIDAALRRADAVLPALLDRLVAALRDAEPAIDDPLRAAALALLATQVADGEDWTEAVRAADGPYVVLAALPLLRNALGRWRPVIACWRPEVHRGDEPVDAELAPWLDELVWVPPGDAARVLVAGAAGDHATRAVIAGARRRRRNHAGFLTRPVREARVERRAESRVRAPIGAGPAGCVPPRVFDGLIGEVCIATGGGPGQVTLLFERRALETVAIEAPLAIDAVIDGAALTPDEHYRYADDDPGRQRALVAVAGAAIRAVEALCVDEPCPGVTIAAPRRHLGDALLIRGALALAHRRAFTIADDTPLAAAAVWPTAGGRLLSLAELRRAPALATAAPGAPVTPPGGRITVTVDPFDRTLLTALVAPVPVVHYGDARAVPAPDPAQAMARHLIDRTGGATLVIRTPSHGGAIAFARHRTLALAHRGVIVSEVARKPALVDCAIAIDSEAVVPTPEWRSMIDDGGAAALDLAGWERALIRATAQALLGDATPELHVAQRPIRLEDPTGRALCDAIIGRGIGVIDAPLAIRLRAHPMLHALGRPQRISIDELCRDFPRGPIPVLKLTDLDDHELGIPGWSPLVADDTIRGVVERLAGRSTIDGAAERTRRRAEGVRAMRVAALRLRPVTGASLPAECAPEPIGAELPGVVGCQLTPAPDLEVSAYFEGRLCARLVVPQDLPALAAVEVGLDELTDELAAVRDTARDRVLGAVRLGVGRWLVAAAAAHPTWIAEHEATRRLLVAWLARAAGGRERTRVIEALRAAPAWPTAQGGRCAPAAAVRGAGIRVAEWSGAWLTGATRDPLDEPVIALPAGAAGDEARAILDGIGVWMTDDVTTGVRRLQTERRIASGAIPLPRVAHAEPALTRRLDELGVRHDFGPGEIALVDAPESALLIHADGLLAVRYPLDVTPAVQLAIESPELAETLLDLPAPRRAQVRGEVKDLAAALVAAVVADPAAAEPPPWLRRRVRRALLTGALDPALIERVPIFETTADRAVSWSEVLEQQAGFGEVWMVTAAPPGPPLDPLRVVLRLDDAEVAAAAPHRAITLVAAAGKLEQDARTRRNRARAPVAGLALPGDAVTGALGRVDLPPGPHGEHGVVIALLPTAAGLRGVLAHRGLVPFDRVADPCRWPTFAIVEAPALTPDPTWSVPVADEAWRALAARIEEASAAALAQVVEAPARARTSVRIAAWSQEIAASRAVTGVLWLEPDQDATGVVTVSTISGDVELDAPDHLPVSGRLFAFPEPADLAWAVAALCKRWLFALRPLRRPEAPRPAPTPPPVPRPEPARAAPAPPPHPLRELAIALHARLQTLGDTGRAITRVDIRGGVTSPLIAVADTGLALAGEAPLLRGLASALATEALRADGGVDALAAHAVTLLNHAHTAVTDADERAALSLLVAR